MTNQRRLSAESRREYERENPRCEFRGRQCQTATSTTHHIVQKAGGSFELKENYLAVCDRCHHEIHATNARSRCIEIKKLKDEWLENDKQITVFGRFYW